MELAQTPVRDFHFNGRKIQHGDPTMICGIVNVTPDSFSDGGQWYGTDKAVNHALDLVAAGCDMIDIGGESTRPGSTYVEIKQEIQRIVPVIKALRQASDVIISVDTWKADVAQAAIEAGADIINDITGLLGDPKMAQVIADSNVGCVAMFNPVIARPNHPSAKVFPKFGADGVFTEAELAAFADLPVLELMERYFDKSLEYAKTAGLSNHRIMLDPGIGFGLTKRENYLLVREASLIHEWGYTCFLGVSRKRFIQNTLAEAGFDTDTHQVEVFALRDAASASLTAVAAFMGIEVVRVHVAKEHVVAGLIGSNIHRANQLEETHFEAYQNKKGSVNV